MRARIPLDVDLEDRLIYGLTPTRFGYLAVACVGGFAIWSTGWLPMFIRSPLAALAVLAGAAAAWGTFDGRPLDRWAIDAARFMVANHRLETDVGWPSSASPARLLMRLRVARRIKLRAHPDRRLTHASPGLDEPP